jgi:hypothetical protein
LIIWNGILFPEGSFEVVSCSRKPIVGDLCDGRQSATGISGHRVFGRSCSPPSGPNQSDFDDIGTLGMHRPIEKAAGDACGGTRGDEGPATNLVRGDEKGGTAYP